VIPDGVTTSVFPRVYRRLSTVGVEFDRWQQGFGMAALGCRDSGKYAATVGGVVDSWPRQVGKTFTVGNLLIGLCLEFPGTRCIWTSHHNRTTTNTFRSMQGMVRSKKIWPHLDHSGVGSPIRTANGEQEIRFANGSIIMFGAREQGFGRGMDKIDFIVFDEAQILGLKALEDMVPSANASRHPHGALLFFIGTPPRPTDDGEAFTVKREKAIAGKTTDQFYCEFSADPDAEVDDRSQWHVMNPSYPHRTPLEAMLRMRENLPDEDAWRREAMGIWPTRGGGVIGSEQWAALADAESVPVDPVAFAVYVNMPRSVAAIGVAGYREDGRIHVGVVPAAADGKSDSLPGTAWIPGRLADLVEKWSPCAVVLDGRSAAGSLIPELEAAGIDLTITNATDMARACGAFYDRVVEGQIRHTGSMPLARAAVSAKRRELADAWAWDRKDKGSDITQLVAATLALHGLVANGEPKETEVWGFWE
jgi:phage terminase large subunit-like protein